MYLLHNYVYFHFQEPTEVKLGDVLKLKGSHLKKVSENFYMVPLLDSLKKLLSDDFVQEEVSKFYNLMMYACGSVLVLLYSCT